MFGIVLSALNATLGFIFRGVLVKFVVFFGLFYVVTEFVDVLLNSGLLPSSAGLGDAFGGVPAGVWYFLDLFNFSAGFALVLSAYVSRFIIRRIPLIG